MVQVVCLSFFKFLKLNEFVIDRIFEGNIERFELLVMFDMGRVIDVIILLSKYFVYVCIFFILDIFLGI